MISLPRPWIAPKHNSASTVPNDYQSIDADHGNTLSTWLSPDTVEEPWHNINMVPTLSDDQSHHSGFRAWLTSSHQDCSLAATCGSALALSDPSHEQSYEVATVTVDSYGFKGDADDIWVSDLSAQQGMEMFWSGEDIQDGRTSSTDLGSADITVTEHCRKTSTMCDC
jgi:hypothetical protein